MKKLIGLIAVIVLLSVLMPVMGVGAVSTTANITITATGSVLDISVDPTSWDVGSVIASATVDSAINDFTLTSNGAANIDVTIAGRSMENVAGDHVWTLSNTQTPGADTIGMKAGLDDAGDLFDINILNVGQTLEKLVANFATGTQDFGLEFLAPTSGIVDAEVMEMVGAGGESTDVPRGLVLTASVAA